MNSVGKRFIPVCAIVALLTFASAEDWPAPAKIAHVHVEPVQPVILTPGKPATVRIRLQVAPGFHINASQPTSELLIPTRIEIYPIPEVKVGKPAYPPGEDFVFQAAPAEKLKVYSGVVSISVPLTAARPIRPGEYKLRAGVKYQACDDRSCFPPKTVQLELPVVVRALNKG